MTGEFDFDPARPSPLKKQHQQAYRGEPRAQPALPLRETWYEECQRLHDAGCAGQWAHDLRKRTDHWKQTQEA